MSIELLIGNESGTKAYLPAVEEGIEWTTERKSTPGKLTFKVLKDDVLDFSEGSAVRLKADGDEIFFGFVFKQQRAKEQIITVTAYDQLRYLKNKDTIVYENKTADQFLRMIAADYALNVGVLENTGYVIGSRVEENTTSGADRGQGRREMAQSNGIHRNRYTGCGACYRFYQDRIVGGDEKCVFWLLLPALWWRSR